MHPRGQNQRSKECNAEQKGRSFFLKVPGIPPRTAKALRESLDEARLYGIHRERECLIVLEVACGARMLPVIEGDRCRVELPHEYNNLLIRCPADSLILIHNHHANVSFSGPDLLKFLSFRSVYASVLACADGTTYYVARRKGRSATGRQYPLHAGNENVMDASGDSDYDVERIMTDYHWNHVCLTARYSREIAAGALSEKEALYNHGHENMVRLARMHGFRYGRVGGPPNHPIVDLRRLGE